MWHAVQPDKTHGIMLLQFGLGGICVMPHTCRTHAISPIVRHTCDHMSHPVRTGGEEQDIAGQVGARDVHQAAQVVLVLAAET